MWSPHGGHLGDNNVYGNGLQGNAYIASATGNDVYAHAAMAAAMGYDPWAAAAAATQQQPYQMMNKPHGAHAAHYAMSPRVSLMAPQSPMHLGALGGAGPSGLSGGAHHGLTQQAMQQSQGQPQPHHQQQHHQHQHQQHHQHQHQQHQHHQHTQQHHMLGGAAGGMQAFAHPGTASNLMGWDGQHVSLPSTPNAGFGGEQAWPPPRMGRGGGGPGGGRYGRPAYGAGRGGRRGGFGANGYISMDSSDAPMESLLLRIRQLLPDQPIQTIGVDDLRKVDSRGLATLLKELGKGGALRRSHELFDWVRRMDRKSELSHLCDVFTYTAMISLCTGKQEVDRALALSEDMKRRGIDRNVHSFSALMNVCIKAGRLQQALDVYVEMRQEGCSPNVVTYNTLIDVYGKTGQWAEALKVIEQMKSQGIQPVIRTYNTLMIACNSSGQWHEALAVYNRLMDAGHTPNTITYNALISAYSRAGRLEKVMESFNQMVRQGCPRSVITYSALISACEKAGQWELALQLFNQMHEEGCTPNVITYNSLITACAQGTQWERAAEVFERMRKHNCTPDVVTYTALITAYERGGQWRRALEAFEHMRRSGCEADAIVFNTAIDALWETGVVAAQTKAIQIYRLATQEGHIKAPSLATSPDATLEIVLHSLSSGVAMLMLHCWLADARDKLQREGPDCLPRAVFICTGRSRHRDGALGTTIVKDAVMAFVESTEAPFTPCVQELPTTSKLQASGKALGEWLLKPATAQLLASFSEAATPALPEPDHNSPTDSGISQLQPLTIPADGLTGATAGGIGSSSSSVGVDAGGELAASASARSDGGPSPADNVMSPGEVYSGQIRSTSSGGSSTVAYSALSPVDSGSSAAANRAPGGATQAVPEEREVASGGATAAGGSSTNDLSLDMPYDDSKEATAERRCAELFQTVQHFETTHCLNVQAMGPGYLQVRTSTINRAFEQGPRVGLRGENIHDGVLLLDRAMSTGMLPPTESALAAAAAASLLIVAQQSGLGPHQLPAPADIAAAFGVEASEVATAELSVRGCLANDTSSISALRCLKLYMERLGFDLAPVGTGADKAFVQDTLKLINLAVLDTEFLNYRPSITAAAVLYCARLQKGQLPFWPSSLAILTGYSNAHTPELLAAINGAQRLYRQLVHGPGVIGIVV